MQKQVSNQSRSLSEMEFSSAFTPYVSPSLATAPHGSQDANSPVRKVLMNSPPYLLEAMAPKKEPRDGGRTKKVSLEQRVHQAVYVVCGIGREGRNGPEVRDASIPERRLRGACIRTAGVHRVVFDDILQFAITTCLG